MLRAARRVLRPGGRLAFSTIELAPDVPRAVRRRIRDHVPRAVASRRPYRDLLVSAGFTDIGSRDVTDAYRRTAHDWLAETRRHVDELRAASTPAEADELLATREMMVEQIEAGHLRRRLYWADR